jgi:hypothetical protein
VRRKRANRYKNQKYFNNWRNFQKIAPIMKPTESSSPLFSTPQRNATRSTPLSHHSPNLSPIISSVKGEKKLTTENLLSRIVEGSDEQNSSDSHQLILTPAFSLTETPMREDYGRDLVDHRLNESLRSISLLQETSSIALSKLYHPGKTTGLQRDKQKISDALQSLEFPLNQSVDSDERESTVSPQRQENRKLIEFIQSKYGSHAQVSHSLKSSSSQPVYLEEQTHPTTGAYSSQANAPRFGRNSEEAATPFSTNTDIRKTYSVYESSEKMDGGAPDFFSPRNEGTNQNNSPRHSSASSLPIGSFYTLILDNNKHPIMVPIAPAVADSFPSRHSNQQRNSFPGDQEPNFSEIGRRREETHFHRNGPENNKAKSLRTTDDSSLMETSLYEKNNKYREKAPRSLPKKMIFMNESLNIIDSNLRSLESFHFSDYPTEYKDEDGSGIRKNEQFEECFNAFYFRKAGLSAKVDHLYWNHERSQKLEEVQQQHRNSFEKETGMKIQRSDSPGIFNSARKLVPTPKRMRLSMTPPKVSFESSLSTGYESGMIDLWKSKLVKRNFNSVLGSPRFS